MQRSFQVRSGVAGDCAAVVGLQADWINRSRAADSADEGYMYGTPYTVEELAQLVTNDALIVAECDGQVAGFALADNWTSNETTRSYADRATGFNAEGKFGAYRQVCVRTSAALRTDLHGSGAYRALIGQLRTKTNARFDALMGTVSKRSRKMDSHQGIGWVVFAEDEHHRYVLMPTR